MVEIQSFRRPSCSLLYKSKRSLRIAVAGPGGLGTCTTLRPAQRATKQSASNRDFLECIKDHFSKLAALANSERHSTGTATHAYASIFTSKMSEGQQQAQLHNQKRQFKILEEMRMMTKRIMTLDFERGDCSLFRYLHGRIRKPKSLQKQKAQKGMAGSHRWLRGSCVRNAQNVVGNIEVHVSNTI